MLATHCQAADQAHCARVIDQVDALFAPTDPLPADAIGPKMARLRREHH